MQDLIAGGRFQNQSEVIRAGLRLLEDREYGYDESLESELLKRLESRSTRWRASDLNEVRKLGRAQLKLGIKTAA